MTLPEYNAKYDEYCQKLKECYTKELYEKFNNFKYKYMTSVLTEYAKTADTAAKQLICELLDYAINHSESGSCITEAYTEEVAKETESILWSEFGDYLLDSEVYEDKTGNCWVVDVMFGGAYIPYWDGDEYGGKW